MGTLAGLLGLASPVAEAASLRPIDLSVEDGEERWRASPAFALRWTNPAGVAAVHYRLLSPTGDTALAERTVEWPAAAIESVSVPGPPGAYTAEVWLEGADGTLGEPATAKLRFDDRPPAAVEPIAGGEWIGRAAFPHTIRVEQPAAPFPVSGIRGYAASVDRDPEGRPCAATVCEEAEVDQRGGPSDALVAIGELPEGTWFLHVAAVSGANVPSLQAGTAVLRVDKMVPLTRLTGVPEGWSRWPVTLNATASDLGAGMSPLGGGPGPFTAIAVDGAPPVLAPGDAVGLTLIDSGAHTVAYYARDAAGNVADGGTTNGQPNHEPPTAVVRIDREPPRIAFARSQDPRDPERIEALAADSLSGLDLSRGSIEVRAAGSRAPFERLPTEARAGALRAHWDSASWPPGEYEFRAIAFDAAGNPASTEQRVSGEPMQLTAPVKPAPRVLARLSGQAARPDRGSRLVGRLVAGRHAPLAGLPVRVLERFATGAVPQQRVSAVTTDADGRFTVHLEPGPSREVFALSPATPTLRAATSQPLRIAVPARIGLHASSTRARIGERPIVFSGSVAATAARIPADGKLVNLQFRLPGLPWREFRTIRTDRRGHFRYAYRFADDDSRGIRFQFRAVAPAEANWPYQQAHSRPVIVTGV